MVAYNSYLPTSFHKLFTFYYRRFEKFNLKRWNSTKYTYSRSTDGKITTDCGFYYMDDSSYALCNLVAEVTTEGSRILELSCNCGRHLNQLIKLNRKNLTAMDIDAPAINLGKEVFSEVHQYAKVFTTSVERFYDSLPDNEMFDVTFNRGTSIEHVPPCYPLVQNICKHTKNYVILRLSDDHSFPYPRNFIYEFKKQGFDLVYSKYIYLNHFQPETVFFVFKNKHFKDKERNFEQYMKISEVPPPAKAKLS
jgi:SAM-dependent methyltransferase